MHADLLVILVRVVVTRNVHVLGFEPFHEFFELGVVAVADDFGLYVSSLMAMHSN